MSVLDKKNENTPKNEKNNNLKNTKYQNVNWRGPVFTFSLPEVRAALFPAVS